MTLASIGVSLNGFADSHKNKKLCPSWLCACVAGLMMAYASFVHADPTSFQGTWQLVKRALPDGTILTPPTVQGLVTITNGLEQTIVYWPTPEGKPASVAQIDKFEMSDTEVVATPLLLVLNDGSGNPPVYVVGGETRRSPITKQGSRVSYQHPTHPPFVVWDGDNFNATLEGAFTDYWEKLK